jgi:hypothetical protein
MMIALLKEINMLHDAVARFEKLFDVQLTMMGRCIYGLSKPITQEQIQALVVEKKKQVYWQNPVAPDCNLGDGNLYIWFDYTTFDGEQWYGGEIDACIDNTNLAVQFM